MAIIPITKIKFYPHFTLTFLLYLLLLPTHITSVNILKPLSAFPDLSSFAAAISATDVSDDISLRSSLTLLAVPNRNLPRSPSADSIRYHILLQYLTISDLRLLPPSGHLIPTLFQATGRAENDYGSLNVSFDTADNSVTFRSPSSSAKLISSAESIPYNLSILTVDSLLTPIASDLTASQTRPSHNLNITKILIEEGHSFNVAASMLAASGVGSEFEQDEGGAGITLFVPTDEAFANLLPGENFQSLPANKKADVLKFHVLRSYYPLGSLESIVNPVQPTLATEEMGAGSYTLNISKINGSVAINTGFDVAMVTQTVFDQNPVAIFGVSKVLLPREIFGKDPTVKNNKPDVAVEAPDFSPAPERSNGPAGYREEIRSSVAARGVGSQSVFIGVVYSIVCICITFFFFW